MEISIVDWILTIAESFISEIILSEKDGLIKKFRYRRFLKSLQGAIMDFCTTNECVYLNSSAFEYFIRHSKFVERTIERALSLKVNMSTKDFQRQMIKEAREIAAAEDEPFFHKEEHLIKDLYKVISEKTSKYYNDAMSTEQKRIVSITVSTMKDFHSDVMDAMTEGNTALTDIQSTLKSFKKLGDAKAEPIIVMLARMMWEGRFEEINKWLPIIQGKSDDLEYAVKVLKNALGNQEQAIIISDLRAIESPRIRDVVVRNILPLLMLNKVDIKTYEEFVLTRALREIISFVSSGDYKVLFGETIENDCGVEVHSFQLSKKYMCEEEWLVCQLFIYYLHGMPIYNISNAMDDFCEKHENWLNKLLIIDKKVDELGCENHDKRNNAKMCNIITGLKEKEEIYQHTSREIKELYYAVLFKADACTQWEYAFANDVPSEVLSWENICAFVIQKKIDKKEISLDEVHQFCKSNNKYCLLVNYFVVERNAEKLIEFCMKDESVFKQEVRMYFLFIGALREQEKNEFIKQYLEKYAKEFDSYYEYWSELLRLDSSKKRTDEFISKCNEDKIVFLFSESEYRLVEKLLDFDEYDVVKKYIHRLELHNRDKFLIKKYRAATMLATDEAVEALGLFREAFEMDPNDSYVVDRIITLSLSNNRNVESKYINAAIRIGTSRMYLLVAEVYISQGDLSEAKKANKKAILLSTTDITPAYGQFMNLETRIKENKERKISCVESDVAVHLINEKNDKKCVCVHDEKALPYSPFIWNDDIHLYIEDAAEMGILRKKKDDTIILNGEEYCIVNITPLDMYFFSICIEKMEAGGLVHTLRVAQSEDKMDLSELTNWLKENSKDEKENYDWRKNYNSLEEVPLPLFMYKRFTRATYLMFVHVMFEDKNVFIRESQGKVLGGDIYVMSFTSLMLLYELGVPVSAIKNGNAYITESTLMQIKTDALNIINEYDRDTVSSIGVFDGNLFMNVVEEEDKDKIVTMAGKILKYVEQIECLSNEHDLKGDIFSKIDAKDILGICDYDAIGVVQNTKGAVLLATELFHYSLGTSELIDYSTISVIDWLIQIGTSATELICYAKKMVGFGCLLSVNVNLVMKLSNVLADVGREEALIIYETWDDLFSVYEELPEEIKKIAVQNLSRTFALIYNNDDLNVDEMLTKITTRHLLELNRMKVEIRIDEHGYIETVLYQVRDGAENVVKNN